MLDALPRQKIRDAVAERIKQLISSEGLGPGDRLPNETDLAKRLKVSRLSVREATKALEYLGIVQSKTGVGLTVGQLDLARVTDHLTFHPALQNSDPAQLIDCRVIIETGVLPYVAERMRVDPAIYDRSNAIVEQLRSARTLARWVELDIQFHRTLLEASGLEPIIAFGDLLQVFFQRFRHSLKRNEWKNGIESHQRIIDLLRRQRVSAASKELKSHIESHRQRL